MIQTFTNVNSNVRVTSFIKENISSSYKETNNTGYTILPREGKLKFEIENFEIRREQKVSKVRLICYFSNLEKDDVLELKYSNNMIDRVIVGSNQEYIIKNKTHYVSFDITDFVYLRSCIGSLLPMELTWTSQSNKNLIQFVGFNYIDDQNNECPLEDQNVYLMVTYSNIEGIENHFAYDQKNIGTSGNALVNIMNGHLIYELPISLVNPNISQVVPELIFNSLKNNESSKYGKGFRGPIDFDFDDSKKDKGLLKLTDPTLKKTYYTKLSKDDRYKLTMEKEHDVYYCYSDSTYIVEDEDESYSLVNNGKRMNFKKEETGTEINYFEFEDGTKISVIYENGLPISLLYPNDVNDVFVYDSSHLIKYISERFGIETTFIYDGDLLTEIIMEKIAFDFANDMSEVRKAIRHTRLSYEEERLVGIINQNERKSLHLEYLQGKVSKIIECAIDDGENEIEGNVDTLSYGNGFTIVGDSKKNETYYCFDDYGSCVYSLDKNGVSHNYKFGTISDSDLNAECHKLRAKYMSQGNIPNLLYNGSFEFEEEPLAGWNITKGDAASTSLSKDGLYGDTCLCIKASSENRLEIMQSVNQKTEGTYKLTGFYKSIKGSSLLPDSITIRITYREEITDSSYEYYAEEVVDGEIVRVKEETVSLICTNGKWTFFESPFINVPSDSIIDIVLKCSREMYFDEIQLTKNNFISGHNYLKNSHFESEINSTAKSWSISNMTNLDGVVSSDEINDSSFLNGMIEGNVYKISGSSGSEEKTIYQKVNLKGDSGERLLASCWLFGNKTTNEKFQLEIDVHYQYLKGNKTKKYIFTPNSNEGWKMLSGLVTTEYPYDYVVVKIIHNGFHSVFVDAIQLFKTRTGSTFSYDERGNLMSVSNSTSSIESSYEKNGRMRQKSCSNGELFQYFYDNCTGKIKRIVDNFGNELFFDYSKNGVIKEIKSGNQIIRTKEEKLDNGFISKENELGHKSLSSVDEYGNVTTYIDARGCVIRKEYDVNQRPVEIERSFNNQVINKASISYNSLGKIANIVCPNDTIVSMIYDEFGNRLSTSINTECLETSKYDNPYDANVNEIAVNANSTISKKISYDTKGNIKRVLVNGKESLKYRYDEKARLIEVEDMIKNISYHFNYDLEGTLLSITDSFGNSVDYDIDNLNNVEKEIINCDGLRISSNYVHSYEFNEGNRNAFFERLSRTYYDDMIIGNQGPKGLFGAQPKTSIFRYSYDENVDMNIIELAYSGKELRYDLDNINSERQNDMSSGGKFNKYLWRINFKKSKTVYGWLRLLGKINGKTILSFFGNDISIKVMALGNRMIRLLVNDEYKDLYLGKDQLSNWNMYSLSVFNQEGKTRVCLYLNGNLLHMISLDEEKTNDIRELTIGDTNLGNGQTGDYQEANETPIRIAMLSVGAYYYKKINLKAIFNQSKKYLFDSKYKCSYSGVCAEYLEDNDSDIISLNGSFTSLKKKKPFVVAYSDGSFKIDKTKNFEFDEELNRHVYASFDGIYKLSDKNGCRLSYESVMSGYQKMSMKFKPMNDEDSEVRTVLSFHNNDFTLKGEFYLDRNNNAFYSLNGNVTSLGVKANSQVWNELSISKNQISLNRMVMPIEEVDLSSLIFNFGCSVESFMESEVPSKYLNGYICDILLTKDITTKTNSLSIINEEDSFGRKSTINYTFNGNSIFEKSYSYVNPLDEEGNEIEGRTSTLISSELNELMGNVFYEYDCNNNIISVKETKNDMEKVDTYSYDPIERLVSSSKNNGELINKYSYDGNGNILLHKIICNGVEKDTSYVYDENNKEKLISIINDGVQTSVEYKTNSLYPVKIGDISLRWSLDKLVEATSNRFMLRFEYDYLDRRTKKISKDYFTEYMYDQNKLVAEITGNIKKIFIYDDKDDVYGFILDDGESKKTYFYVKNQLGIINEVIDSEGNVITHYEYDDFGLIINSDQIDFSFNDILYKGYLYDCETKWYILGNRYYSPEMKRFISPDKVDNIIYSIADLAQFSLYAYCGNNPIMRIDGNGQNWFLCAIKTRLFSTKIIKEAIENLCTAVGSAVGSAVGAVTAMASSVNSKSSFSDTVNNTIKGATEGAAIGAKAGNSVGLILAGSVTLDDDLVKEGKKILENSVFPKVLEFAQENILTFMSIADGIHTVVTSPVITLGLLCTGNVIPILIGASCGTYTMIQEKTAENNYKENRKVIGVNEMNLIHKVEKNRYYLMPTNANNVIIDGKIYITNQSDEFYKSVKFGASNLYDSGCGIIATYNMLRYLGKRESLASLIYYYETNNLLFGVVGSWPSHLKKLFDLLGIHYHYTTDEDELSNYENQNIVAMICTYFHEKMDSSINSPIEIDDFKEYLSAHTTFIPRVNTYYCECDSEPVVINSVYAETNSFKPLKKSIFASFGEMNIFDNSELIFLLWI